MTVGQLPSLVSSRASRGYDSLSPGRGHSTNRVGRCGFGSCRWRGLLQDRSAGLPAGFSRRRAGPDAAVSLEELRPACSWVGRKHGSWSLVLSVKLAFGPWCCRLRSVSSSCLLSGFPRKSLGEREMSEAPSPSTEASPSRACVRDDFGPNRHSLERPGLPAPASPCPANRELGLLAGVDLRGRPQHLGLQEGA